MIIISPYSKALLSARENPKNYPYWEELVQKIPKSIHIVQIGIDGEKQLVEDFRKNLPILELRHLLDECLTWISCDSMFQHLAWDCQKKGIVLWSVSDPLIYGHPENINLLSSRDNLAPNQFLWWEHTPHDPNKFVKPEVVLDALQEHFF